MGRAGARPHAGHEGRAAGPLDLHWSRSCLGTPPTVTRSRDTAGRSCGALLVEEESMAVPVVNALVGGEVGLQDVAVLSTGERGAHPQYVRRSERRLAPAPAPRHRARTQKGSKQREQARLPVAREQARMAAPRRAGLPTLTTRRIREHHTGCVEALAVKHRVRPHTLAHALSDAGWGEVWGEWGRVGAPPGG